MKKSRYAEEQIAFALKQAETGTPVVDVISAPESRPAAPHPKLSGDRR